VFAIAYWKLSDDVLGYCVRRFTFSEAEDVASEVFAIAWRRIDDLDWDTAAPWLFGIARGVLSNQRRSASRRLRDDVGGVARTGRAVRVRLSC
jgi:DNA-directed RNA polymerase specialized sigma24 family protein